MVRRRAGKSRNSKERRQHSHQTTRLKRCSKSRPSYTRGRGDEGVQRQASSAFFVMLLAPRDTKGTSMTLRIEKILMMEVIMPRGDKSKYTDKQERKADHIAEGRPFNSEVQRADFWR